MLRLQGFPDEYQIACGYAATRKQVGNSVAIPCVVAVLKSVFTSLQKQEISFEPISKFSIQTSFPFENTSIASL